MTKTNERLPRSENACESPQVRGKAKLRLVRNGFGSLALATGTIAAVSLLAFPASASFGSEPASPSGAFVIGDGNATSGTSIEFWGADWAQKNAVSGGGAPASFKGYADTVTPIGACSGTFVARPGNGSNSPSRTSSTIAVLVTKDVTKTGSIISGTYVNIVLVQMDPGYQADPGHPGTGIVLGSACQGPED